MVPAHLRSIKTLIIDNYDSYTFNLLQLFPDDKNVIVVRNDQFTWEEFTEHILPFVDTIIISPGPGRPERPTDFGICTLLLKAQLDPEQHQYHRPIFGVCLGHQGIGYLLGSKVTYAPRIMHGRMSQIYRRPQRESIFKDVLHDCPSPFWAVRYHSLVVDKDSIPDDLVLTAYCYEDDMDMDALENATYLEDKEGQQEDVTESNPHHHYLPHPAATKGILENEVAQLEVKDSQRITVMGFQHKRLPLWGVQFHPESVSTEHGHQMILTFLKETYRWMVEMGNRAISTQPLNSELLSYSVATPNSVLPPKVPTARLTGATQLYVKPCSKYVSPEVFVNELMKDHAFGRNSMAWLDSSRKSSPYARMSILAMDPALTMSYSTLHREIRTVTRGKGQKMKKQTLMDKRTFFDYISDALEQQKQKQAADPVWITNRSEFDESRVDLEFQGGFIGYFGYEMKRESMDGYHIPEQQTCLCPQHGTDISLNKGSCCACVQEPDAAFQFVDRYFVFDHAQERIYICCLVNANTGNPEEIGFSRHEEAMRWLSAQEESVLCVSEILRKQKLVEEFTGLTPVSSTCTTPIPPLSSASSSTTSNLFKADAEHRLYLRNIEKCIASIQEGESYELCLTTRFRCNLSTAVTKQNQFLYPELDQLNLNTLSSDKAKEKEEDIATLCGQLYIRHLRKNNPAPFSALLLFSLSHDNEGDGSPQQQQQLKSPPFGILSSSPERFLKVSKDHVAEMKPIKGTIRRALHCVCPKDGKDSLCDMGGPSCENYRIQQDNARKQQLWQDVKERAENLMIVDLIRNDLAQVCTPASVCVPKLMHIETYEKVHHLVSTIRGTLYPHVNSVKALQTCFPPGSMTGAPKLRSVQLLDDLESHATRGVYSGCLGYFSLKGSADFNVVIRTAVVVKKSSGVEVSVGGGGAVTFLSDPEQEWREALLKTTSVAPSIQEFLDDQ